MSNKKKKSDIFQTHIFRKHSSNNGKPILFHLLPALPCHIMCVAIALHLPKMSGNCESEKQQPIFGSYYCNIYGFVYFLPMCHSLFVSLPPSLSPLSDP